ncbi:MAG: hypothetical protein RR687_13605, partial [Comamonas sp.]
ADTHGLRNALCVLGLVVIVALLAWRMHWLDAVLPVRWHQGSSVSTSVEKAAPVAADAAEAAK